jgi:hypothetical protein
MPKIEPGPALDALVVEEIFGWRRSNSPIALYIDSRGELMDPPPLSTDPGEALRLLVEENEYRQAHHNLPLSLFTQYRDGCTEWCCAIQFPLPYQQGAWSPTPALAICLGILRSRGVDLVLRQVSA